VLCALLLATLAPAAWAQFSGDFSLGRHALDPENFLDYKAYQHPYPWRRATYTAPNYFRGTVGSLSHKVFYFAEEIRLEKDLGRYASILYFQQEDSFFRPEPIHQEVELRFGEGLYASVVGFPRHEKIDGHQGFALAWGERTDWNYLRLSQVDQFTLFNQENTDDARFSVEPELYRLEARTFWREAVFAQLDLRSERPTTLQSPSSADPALGRTEHYAGEQGDLVLDMYWSEGLLTGLTTRRRWETRRREPLGGASLVTAARQRLELAWTDLYVVLTLRAGNVVEIGAYRGAFRNLIAADAASERFTHHLLTDAAYAVWTHPRSDWFQWVFSLQAGRAGRVFADGAAPELDSDETTTELKAGVGIVLKEAGSYRAFFNTTWDLDIFVHRQWDGGNVQLQWLF
jgi:hypothetical protein